MRDLTTQKGQRRASPHQREFRNVNLGPPIGNLFENSPDSPSAGEEATWTCPARRR